MVKKGLSMEELGARIDFIHRTRDEMVKVQVAKGIPMPHAE
jgi:hypothetical protein